MSSPKGKATRKIPTAPGRADQSGSVSRVVIPAEKSVLIVEADPDVQVQIARALRGQGHRVVGTSSGDGALALITEWAVDLILVSQDLPGRAGVEVTRLLRERRASTPVVLMAASTEAGVCEAALAAGAAGCVMKPLTIDSLTPWLGPARNRSATASAVSIPALCAGPGVAE